MPTGTDWLRWLARLLHSPSLVALGLAVGYETWLQIAVVIGWSKYRLGLPQWQWIVGWRDWWEFPMFFMEAAKHQQSPCTALTAGKMPYVSAVQRDCERVKWPAHLWLTKKTAMNTVPRIWIWIWIWSHIWIVLINALLLWCKILFLAMYLSSIWCKKWF